MRIDISSHGIPLTRELHEYVVRRLSLALDRVEVRVRRVRVVLQDVNGPRGGVDQRCQLQIELAHLPRLVVVETCDDIHASVAGAIDRAVQTVGRQMERQRDAMRRRRGTALRDLRDDVPLAS
jgi:putative sigma-54 modulation protein